MYENLEGGWLKTNYTKKKKKHKKPIAILHTDNSHIGNMKDLFTKATQFVKS